MVAQAPRDFRYHVLASGSFELVAPVTPTASSPGNQGVLIFFVSSHSSCSPSTISPISLAVVFRRRSGCSWCSRPNRPIHQAQRTRTGEESTSGRLTSALMCEANPNATSSLAGTPIIRSRSQSAAIAMIHLADGEKMIGVPQYAVPYSGHYLKSTTPAAWTLLPSPQRLRLEGAVQRRPSGRHLRHQSGGVSTSLSRDLSDELPRHHRC